MPIKLKKETQIIFLINLFIITITYGMFIKDHFSVDSYNLIYDTTAKHFLISGRIYTYILTLLFYKFNINLTLNQSVFSVILIFCISISTTVLLKIIIRYINKINIKKLIMIDMAILISFINVFFLEWFLYPESTFFFGIGLVLAITAIYIVINSRNFLHIMLSFILLMISMGIYQANLSIFIIYSLTICLLKNNFDFNKKMVNQGMIILLIGMLNSILNMLVLKLIYILNLAPKSERAPSIDLNIIKENILGILKQQLSILNNACDLLPKFSVLFFMIIIFIQLIYSVIKNRNNKKSIVLLISVIFINYSIIFAPHIFTSILWLAQRTLIGFFVFLSSIIVIIIFYSCEKNRIFNNVLLISLVLFLTLNLIQIQNIGVNHISSNKIDQEYAEIINKEIEKYEKENNLEVKYIATKNDINPTFNYNSVEYTLYDTNVRAYVTPWADVNMINYFGGKKYKKIDMNTEIYDKYFKDKDWEYFNPKEQFIFKGDTLYLMLY